jgi:RNA polymerase sigma factor for flagellar operon FliA
VNDGIDVRRDIDQYLPWVTKIAKSVAYRNTLSRHLDYKELIGAGWKGLSDAEKTFDPNKGVTFKTFAQLRIKGCMLDELRSRDVLPRLHRRRIKAGILPDIKHFHFSSIDAVDPRNKFDVASHRTSEIDLVYLEEYTAHIFRSLDKRERIIAYLYFIEGKTCKETGIYVGVTENRVSQLLKLIRKTISQSLE